MNGIVNGQTTATRDALAETGDGRTLTRETLSKQFADARAATLRLFDLVPREADLHESPGFGFRPIIWHLAHIGVFEAYWILQKVKGDASPDERYERIFDPIATPREQSKELPTRREMETYLSRVRERVLDFLETAPLDTDDPVLRDGYVFRLVLEHERQHQETLAYLLQLLDPAKKSRTSTSNIDGEPARISSTVDASRDELAPITQSWRERESWQHPLYWSRDGASSSSSTSWRVRAMFVEESLPPQHPVSGVSWYEAQAFARFAGKRLPTEAEWERAASWDASRRQKRLFAWGDEEPTRARCNFDLNLWGTTRVGAFTDGTSEVGCLDMTGNVWEWTSSKLAGYPGFKAFPYPEYSEVWFDEDHRVLRGGSWATHSSVLRTSFRNFFRRHFRIAFAGLRCASDV